MFVVTSSKLSSLWKWSYWYKVWFRWPVLQYIAPLTWPQRHSVAYCHSSVNGFGILSLIRIFMPSFGCLHLDNYGNNLHFFLGDLLHLSDHFFCNHRLQMLMHGEMFTCSLIVWDGTAFLGMQEGVCQPIRMIHGALDRPSSHPS